MNLTGRRSRGAPSRETLLTVRDIVAVRTSGYVEGGLRLDFDRLSEDEQRRTVELVREADEGTWSWERLGDRRRRELEKLIERATGSTGIFKQARDAEEAAEIARIAHQALVQKPITRRAEPGLLAALAEQVIPDGPGRPVLWLDRAGLLLAILLMFSSGRTLSPRSRIEVDEDGQQVLIYDQSFGLLGDYDPRSAYANAPKALQRLEATGWLALSGSGPAREIRLGERALQALGDQPSRNRRAAA